MTLTEVADVQNAIIKMQADIISELYGLLAQHISVEQADALPASRMIDRAERLRESIGERP